MHTTAFSGKEREVMAETESTDTECHIPRAARMNRECALRRVEYYQKIERGLRAQADQIARITQVYKDRVKEAPTDEEADSVRFCSAR